MYNSYFTAPLKAPSETALQKGLTPALRMIPPSHFEKDQKTQTYNTLNTHSYL